MLPSLRSRCGTCWRRLRPRRSPTPWSSPAGCSAVQMFLKEFTMELWNTCDTICIAKQTVAKENTDLSETWTMEPLNTCDLYTPELTVPENYTMEYDELLVTYSGELIVAKKGPWNKKTFLLSIPQSNWSWKYETWNF